MSGTILSTEAVSSEFVHLNNCGKQSFFERTASAYRPNGRVDFHILYIIEGSCFVKLNGKTIEAKAGSMVLFLPKERQEYAYYKGTKSTAYYLHFSGTECYRLLSRFADNNKTVYQIGINSKIIDVFEQLKTEYELSFQKSELLCAGYLLTLLALFERAHESTNSDENQTKFKIIKDICKYIQTSYNKDLTVAALAEMCFLSKSRFSHLFKEATKKSPTEYLLDVRIEKAKDLLQNSDLSISEIAESIGIENLYYFSRIFKSRVGISPSSYKKHLID